MIHWKLAGINVNPAKNYALFNITKKENTWQSFHEIWKTDTKFTVYTWWNTGEYLEILMGLFLLYTLTIWIIKHHMSTPFKNSRGIVKKIAHIFSVWCVPSPYEDWD